MRVSYFELYAHCKKVLEGCGLPIGSAEEGAEIAAWGVFTGLYGIEQLAEEVKILQSSNLSEIRILSQDERVVTLDGQGQSSLLCGRMALDLACSKAEEMGIGIVHVKNSKGSSALIQNAAQAGKRSVSCLIQWMEETSQNWAVMLPDEFQPYVMREDFAQLRTKSQTNGFLVICASEALFATYKDLIAKNEEKESIAVIRPEQVQANWDKSQREGKEIDPAIWAELDLVASLVLVEATELSRQRGAGEGAN
ncbi:DUF3726 domain-containing protein [Brevibacillus centrosporus]|uniref:DUF3726 domain-containing protein n=1 Tax=Brevibacillus centrosporus TaxID=54910 RepID=UPI002E1B1A7E|nr:Ldh family oxidoreductase [Brevibacillus centrosporus]MED1953625.1 Ldh family oxidoreductase [Brevibacillus centrosporus]